MNTSSHFLVLTFVVLASVTLSIAEIDGGLVSTMKIVHKMCEGTRTAEEAQAFWDCYYAPVDAEAKGIVKIFEDCQNKVMKSILNTPENIKSACKPIKLALTFPMYAFCLKTRFDEANLDMDATLDAVNKCEAKVLGVE